ncbi:MAG: alpha/beta hydrolase [Candidatus Obscuribacterales bacterium]|nr:alpha/beta hydrolase [Candidatus Obscuribacterales bacterium]
MFDSFLLPLQNAFNRKQAAASSVSKPQAIVRYWRNLFVFGIATYVVVSFLAVSPLYRFYLFLPFPAGEEYKFEKLDGIPKEDVYVKGADGNTLHGWFFLNKNPDAPVVLVSHGTMGNISSRIALAKALLASGASVLVYDYQGYGLSGGQPSLQALCVDGVLLYDFLVEQKKYHPSQVIVYGESLGCATSCKIVAARKCSGMILQSGFSSLVSAARGMYPLLYCWPDGAFPKPDMNNTEMLKSPHPPLLIVHGKEDGLVPISHAEKNYAGAADPKEFVVFEKSGHVNLVEAENSKFVAVVKGFLDKCKAKSI